MGGCSFAPVPEDGREEACRDPNPKKKRRSGARGLKLEPAPPPPPLSGTQTMCQVTSGASSQQKCGNLFAALSLVLECNERKRNGLTASLHRWAAPSGKCLFCCVSGAETEELGMLPCRPLQLLKSPTKSAKARAPICARLPFLTGRKCRQNSSEQRRRGCWWARGGRSSSSSRSGPEMGRARMEACSEWRYETFICLKNR